MAWRLLKKQAIVREQIKKMADPQNIKNLIEYSPNSITSKVLAKGKNNVTLFCMAAGTELGEHTSTKEGFIYVLEGDGAFILEGRTIEMRPGIFFQMGKNAVHSLTAEKNTSFLLSLCD